MNVSPTQSRTRGVLLVHGAWHTGRTWDGVAAGLRARGVPVAVAQLHRDCLADDIAAAEAALDDVLEFGPVVACGHSAGCVPMTGLPPEKIAHLVYLAGPIVDEGEIAFALQADAPQTDMMSAVVGDMNGVTTIDPAAAGELFYGQLDERLRAANVAGLVPQSMASGYEPMPSAAWHSRPSTYVICTEDRVVHPDTQRIFSKRATNVRTWSSDHCCYASHEAATVDLLAQLATNTEP